MSLPVAFIVGSLVLLKKTTQAISYKGRDLCQQRTGNQACISLLLQPDQF